MALGDLGHAFIKPTPAAIRKYMRAALRGALDQYDSLVLPLAGRFQMAECAVDAGWRVNEILCCDTNVFASLLGYMAAGKDVAELGIAFEHDSMEAEWAREKWGTGNHMAALGLMLKLGSLRVTNTAERIIRNELWARRDHYGNQFQANAQRLAEKLSGLDYKVADVFPIVAESAANARAVLYVDPGHEIGKPFECVGERGAWISWDKPLIAPFEPKTGMAKLHHDLMPAAALAFFHWHSARIPPEYRERSVYVVERGPGVREHILCNRPAEARRLVQPRGESDIEAAPYAVLPADHPITNDSVFQIVPCSKAVGLYYADLWSAKAPRRLGQSFLALMDGYTAAVFGLNFAPIRSSRGPFVEVTYTAVPSIPTLAQRVPLWIGSGAAWPVFEAVADAPLYAVRELRIKLTDDSLLAHWNAVGLNVIERTRGEDGQERISLHGEVKEWTPIALDKQRES